MEKVDGIEWVVVDTTARAHFRTKKGAKVSKEDLDSALKSARCSTKGLKELKLPVPAEEIEIFVKSMA